MRSHERSCATPLLQPWGVMKGVAQPLSYNHGESWEGLRNPWLPMVAQDADQIGRFMPERRSFLCINMLRIYDPLKSLNTTECCDNRERRPSISAHWGASPPRKATHCVDVPPQLHRKDVTVSPNWVTCRGAFTPSRERATLNERAKHTPPSCKFSVWMKGEGGSKWFPHDASRKIRLYGNTPVDFLCGRSTANEQASKTYATLV